jgi:hypothetical protein
VRGGPCRAGPPRPTAPSASQPPSPAACSDGRRCGSENGTGMQMWFCKRYRNADVVLKKVPECRCGSENGTGMQMWF